MAVIPVFLYHGGICRLKKTRPTAARVEFTVGQEKRFAAASTVVYALLFTIPIFTRKRALGALFTANMEFLWCQLIAPYFIIVHRHSPVQVIVTS